MARLVQGPTVYTPDEWHQSNNLNYDKAEQTRIMSEIIRDESTRLCNETGMTTQKTQKSVNKKFEQRLNDINFWNAELDKQFKDTESEIGKMLEYKQRLEVALDATQLPLAISQLCISNREDRCSIDVVHDDVEIQLLKEVEVICGVQAVLKRTLEQAVEQIRLLRSANYYLNKDITDKFSALKIDGECSSLSNSCYKKKYVPNAKITPNSVTPEEWEAFSNKNILKVESERNSSITSRSMIDEILQETHSDQQKQCNAVNLAFSKRINETEKAKSKLEEHLSKVDEEINNMEKNIRSLNVAISDKKAPMQVSQTRLDTRTNRPNIELCCDLVQYKLIDEVGEISCDINRLKKVVRESENALKALVRQKLKLEEDITVKNKTLSIDRDENVVIRMDIAHESY